MLSNISVIMKLCLVQVMPCLRIGAKPLHFNQNTNIFSAKKCIWNCCLQIVSHFVFSGLNELKNNYRLTFDLITHVIVHVYMHMVLLLSFKTGTKKIKPMTPGLKIVITQLSATTLNRRQLRSELIPAYLAAAVTSVMPQHVEARDGGA